MLQKLQNKVNRLYIELLHCETQKKAYSIIEQITLLEIEMIILPLYE